MKSRAKQSTRATRTASPSSSATRRGASRVDAVASAPFTPWVSLAPREADRPDCRESEVAVTVSTTTTLFDDTSDPSREFTCARWLTWTGTVQRELDYVGGDPEEGVAVRLCARYAVLEKSPGKKDYFEEETVNLGPLGNLTVPEFRRMLAGLNAMAAALPATPEVALRSVAAPLGRS